MTQVRSDEHGIDRILTLAGSGNKQAASELLGRFRGRLRSMITARMDSRLYDRVDPSDIVQETMIIAHRRMPEFFDQQEIDFYPWLRGIGWKCLVDQHRRHILAERRTVDREIRLETQLPDDSVRILAARISESNPSPLSRMAADEVQEMVHEALDRLDAPSRDALVLRFLEQLSIHEASQVLGISKGALKSRQVRALFRLKHLLDDAIGDEHP